MTEQQHEKPERTETSDARISWLQLIAYGSGGVIPIALFNIAGQLTALLGNISLGLSAIWLGTILMIPRLWDAVSDPVMGHISDNTRSRWGRRKPYLLVGGIAVALTFVAMWWVPRGDAFRATFVSEAAFDTFQLVFILGGVLLFFTACTVFEIPHGALGMELTSDYHERTRLFSAKSFLGNLFAMGTPWLIAIASLEFFSGPGGDLVDGMRYVSIAIAVVLIPLSFWWFFALEEPGFKIASKQEKSSFWKNMRTAASNTTFLRLIAIVFTLAMGFNFVGLFNYYISIFYLYGGDVTSAGPLLGVAGTVWAVTGLVAVFPLNWLSEKYGKNKTLLIAMALMCAAQLTKIVCYDPELPYLVLIPTALLSAGMFMFFTLGYSLVGDICDEDELKTGTRSEGSYYSVYWWFIKMGTAFASFVTGVLLVVTHFDETQNVTADGVQAPLQVIQAEAKAWLDPSTKGESSPEGRAGKLEKQIEKATKALKKLEERFADNLKQEVGSGEHVRNLIAATGIIKQSLQELESQQNDLLDNPVELKEAAEQILKETVVIKRQSPTTLLRLRVIEIGLPLVLCAVSIWLTLGYPLTEERCYEISAELKARHTRQDDEP